MDVTIKNEKLRRTASYDDVVSIRQENGRIIIMDKNGWATSVILHDDAEVIISGCEV